MGQRVVHFEIAADDPKRAIAFYSKAFGWEFIASGGPDDYFLASTGEGPGIDGAVMERSELVSQPVVNTIQVDDYDRAAEAVRSNGGEVLQDKLAIPGVGWFSYCRDTEGNTFGIMQEDTAAS